MSLVVSLEGMPLAGKTTLASLVHEYYKIKGYDSVLYTETRSSDAFILAKRRLLNPDSPRLSTAFLLASNVVETYEKLLRLVTRHEIVVVDDMFSDFLVYTTLENLNLPFLDEFLLRLTLPHFIFYLKRDYKKLDLRKVEKSLFPSVLRSEEVYNKIETGVRSRLLKYCYHKARTIENNSDEPMQVFKEIKPILDELLKLL